MTDVWNNVTVYGPQAEIKRFRKECLRPEETVIRDGQLGWDGCQCAIEVPTRASFPGNLIPKAGYSEEVWNFQQFTQDSSVEFSFSFDTDGEFPTEIFEELAKLFPRLAFDCHCIEALDDFLGYGWYNAPPGGEPFRQGYPVPREYWTSGCPKRSPKAAQQHEARINRLREMLISDAS